MPQLNEYSVRERVQYPFPALALPLALLAHRISAVLGRVPRAVRLAPVIALGLAALFSAACATSIPVRLAKSAQVTPGIEGVLEDAAGILGRPIEVVDGGRGAVTLSIVRSGGPYAGEAIDRAGCRRNVWAEPRGPVVAHELGHALGLEHDDRPDNVMHRFIGREVEGLDDEQDAIVEREVTVLHICGGRVEQ